MRGVEVAPGELPKGLWGLSGFQMILRYFRGFQGVSGRNRGIRGIMSVQGAFRGV